MSKKSIVLGLVGALGVSAFATAASADSYGYQPQPQVQTTAPVRPIWNHQVNTPAPLPPAPYAPPTVGAAGQWSWNGTRYVWVAQLPAPTPAPQYNRGERRRIEEARRAEAARIEAARIEAARVEAARIEAARIEAIRQARMAQQARRMEQARRAEEARRAEQARIEALRIEQARHHRHTAPDGTQVIVRYGHK